MAPPQSHMVEDQKLVFVKTATRENLRPLFVFPSPLNIFYLLQKTVEAQQLGEKPARKSVGPLGEKPAHKSVRPLTGMTTITVVEC